MSAFRVELKAMSRLAVPLVLGQVGFQAMVMTDILMIGMLGPEALAANGLAGALYTTAFLFGVGVVAAVGGLMAQSYGAGDRRRLGDTASQALWVAFLIAMPLMAVLFVAEPLLIGLGQEPAAAARAQTYLWGVAPAMLFGLASNVFRGLFATHRRARIAMIVTWVGVAINAAADYVLILGKFGFPRLELFGSGLATSCVSAVTFAIYAAIATWDRDFRDLRLFRRLLPFDGARIREILWIGLPAGVMLVMEVGIFGMANLMMGWIGMTELAAFAIALQFISLIFMVPLGLSQAATVRVGNAHGAGDVAGVRRAASAAYLLTFLFMAAMAVLLLSFPSGIAGLYLDEGTPGSLDVVRIAASFLAIAALFQIADGAQVVGASALRGISDTRVPMIMAIICYWGLGFVPGYVFGFVLGYGAVGVWYGLLIGLGAMALMLAARFVLLTRPRRLAPAVAPEPAL